MTEAIINHSLKFSPRNGGDKGTETNLGEFINGTEENVSCNIISEAFISYQFLDFNEVGAFNWPIGVIPNLEPLLSGHSE